VNSAYTPPEVSEHAVFHRWSAEIILQLADGQKRFNRLLTGIPGISDRVLTCRLGDLEAAGLISRQVMVGPPVRVLYGLTAYGRRFLQPIEQLGALVEPALREAIATA